jgi:hypothetical protein
MKLISHRGNLEGANPSQENSPFYILNALNHGFDVEIDVWFVNGNFVLGHDKPHHRIEPFFLNDDRLWCHAKNREALQQMMERGVHCFWHNTDDYTITSRGYAWCYFNHYHSKGITVVRDDSVVLPDWCYGICSDNPVSWKERLTHV